MPEPSSLASWTRALRKQLDALGADSNALCQSAGIDPCLLDDPAAQFPSASTALLWELAIQTSLDPTLGLRVSRFVSPTTFHALGYTLVASGSLREVFERIVRSTRLPRTRWNWISEPPESATSLGSARRNRVRHPSMSCWTHSPRSTCALVATVWAEGTHPWRCICNGQRRRTRSPGRICFAPR